ncbi:MAG: TldD/PmbA family protein [Erysipelotrichaceae bacterium]|nr:TldD/PmbA family protein [Erysipelotrichaceae bacterium]
MKTHFSNKLQKEEAQLQQLITLLRPSFDYVSILATDVRGDSLRVSSRMSSVSDYDGNEQGYVVRVYQNGLYSEVSFNVLTDVKELAQSIQDQLQKQLDMLQRTKTKVLDTPKLEEEETELLVEKEVEQLPETLSIEQRVERLNAMCKKGMAYHSNVVEFMASLNFVHVNKMFLSTAKCLKQSYVFSEASIVAVVRDETQTKMDYKGFSGLKGAEILKEMENHVEEVVDSALELLATKRVVPGEYDIITTPEVSGLIAHEAFGHGVEMDMFVKNRALAKQYIGKPIASPLVEMHEGALVADSTAAYAFDDEGTLANDVTEIKDGILQTGIADALSALRLGIKPTGNGKRESFERKAYTRMTNTVFMGKENTLEEMIASIQHGYLLEGMQSGMEDPKHWGIQCMLTKGREIKDGALTGVVVSPVILTGYVPDLLKSITMVGKDVKVDGNGYCGKGYKEWVKAADGGPYLKAKGRLG